MEKKYQSLPLFQFQQQFPDDQACYDYLAQLKWPDGFICEKCQHTCYCKGKLGRTRQCTQCSYQAIPTQQHAFSSSEVPHFQGLLHLLFGS